MNAELAELQALQLASNTRLLVIDDEPLILASLEALLKHKHYQVDTALGGKIACQQLEQNHYDLVLLDLNMADVDGFAVMAFMADQGIDAAIVVVSGESTFDAVRKALRMGASDYVKKPYSPEELFATIDSTFHKINLRIDALSAIVNDSSEGVSAREERLIKSLANHGAFLYQRGKNMNALLAQIVVANGGTVTDPDNRNQLLKDWLNAL